MTMFSIRSSSTNGWSRPSRNSESNTAWAVACWLRGAPRAVAGVDGLGHRRLDEVQHDRPAEFLLRRLVQTARDPTATAWLSCSDA